MDKDKPTTERGEQLDEMFEQINWEYVEKALAEFYATVSMVIQQMAKTLTDFFKVNLVKLVYQCGLVSGRVYYHSRHSKTRVRKKQRAKVRKELKKLAKRQD